MRLRVKADDARLSCAGRRRASGPDLIVVDPPRTGLGAETTELLGQDWRAGARLCLVRSRDAGARPAGADRGGLRDRSHYARRSVSADVSSGDRGAVAPLGRADGHHILLIPLLIGLSQLISFQFRRDAIRLPPILGPIMSRPADHYAHARARISDLAQCAALSCGMAVCGGNRVASRLWLRPSLVLIALALVAASVRRGGAARAAHRLAAAGGAVAAAGRVVRGDGAASSARARAGRAL